MYYCGKFQSVYELDMFSPACIEHTFLQDTARRGDDLPKTEYMTLRVHNSVGCSILFYLIGRPVQYGFAPFPALCFKETTRCRHPFGVTALQV